MSAVSSDEDDLINIGDLPPEPVRLTRIGEVPQISDVEHLPSAAIVAEPDDEPFPNLLPPAGKSSAEAQALITPEQVKSPALHDKFEERLTAPPPPEEPVFLQLTLSDAILLSAALAIGLALGRLDTSGVLALLLGLGAAVALGRTLLFADADHNWTLAAVAGLMLYVGATLGTAALRWLTGGG